MWHWIELKQSACTQCCTKPPGYLSVLAPKPLQAHMLLQARCKVTPHEGKMLAAELPTRYQDGHWRCSWRHILLDRQRGQFCRGSSAPRRSHIWFASLCTGCWLSVDYAGNFIEAQITRSDRSECQECMSKGWRLTTVPRARGHHPCAVSQVVYVVNVCAPPTLPLCHEVESITFMVGPARHVLVGSAGHMLT